MLKPEEITLRIIVDNIAPDGLLEEHGFSAWIEAGGERILFDAGKGEAFSHNRQALGIDLRETTLLVLSHGHYDHTGGVAEALRLAPGAKAVLHPGAFTRRWSIRGGVAKPTAMPEDAKAALRSLPEERLLLTQRAAMIAEGIGVTGTVPRRNSFEDPGGPFFLDTGGLLADRIEDDMTLWIETTEGLVIVTGCCHSGVVNTLDYIIELSGQRRIHSLIGGLHLSSASPERLRRTTDALARYDIGRIVACHCTGQAAAEHFQRELPFPVTLSHAGMGM